MTVVRDAAERVDFAQVESELRAIVSYYSCRSKEHSLLVRPESRSKCTASDPCPGVIVGFFLYGSHI